MSKKSARVKEDKPSKKVVQPHPAGSSVQSATDPIWLPCNEVKKVKLEWLWTNRVPFGGLTFLEGDPGLGKSTVAFDLAARVTQGKAMPDEKSRRSRKNQGDVLILSAEDDPGLTIVPRLQAAGADMSKVHIPDRKKSRSEHFRLPELCKQIAKQPANGNTKLVILDPWVSFLRPGLSPFIETDCRTALEPLADLAAELRLAVICIRHPTKNTGQKALYRGGGSLGISAIARVIITVQEHSETPDVSVFCGVKNNLGPLPVPLAYTLEPVGDSVRVNWRGPVDQKAGDLIAEIEAKTRISLLEQAKRLIRLALADGEKPSNEVIKEGSKSGIKETTLHNAKTALSVGSERREGPDGNHYWAWIPPEKWPSE